MSATGARRNENVGAPTWIRNVVVYIGAGTTRRAAVANGAGMVGVSGEWGVTSGERRAAKGDGRRIHRPDRVGAGTGHR